MCRARTVMTLATSGGPFCFRERDICISASTTGIPRICHHPSPHTHNKHTDNQPHSCQDPRSNTSSASSSAFIMGKQCRQAGHA
jgi:hypothetical protein